MPARSLLVILLVLTGTAEAAAPEPVTSGTVADVIDGDTVRLESGVQIRLVGIQAPKLPLGRPNFPTWPLAGEARDAVVSLVDYGPVTLAYGGRQIDRHGRLLAHLYNANGVWVQGAMLEAGLARVYTFSDNVAHAAEMLERERAARAARRGMWALATYRIRTPEEAANDRDTFQLVEGKVVAAAVVHGRGYLNFGPDYRTDFTISIGPRDMKRFRAAGLAPKDYEGRRVRVRGWIRWLNGPMIDATHPEQIERLE